MGSLRVALQRHPTTPSATVRAIWAQVEQRPPHALSLRYEVETSRNALIVPAQMPPDRTDGLWRTTCFELFVEGPDDGYFEFNFSPSSQWAAYRFAAYRRDMRALAQPSAPGIISHQAADRNFVIAVECQLPCDGIASPPRLGLSAVIEEVDGTKSYWALAHPPGLPDFHHPDCFALTLPAASET